MCYTDKCTSCSSFIKHWTIHWRRPSGTMTMSAFTLVKLTAILTLFTASSVSTDVTVQSFDPRRQQLVLVAEDGKRTKRSATDENIFSDEYDESTSIENKVNTSDVSPYTFNFKIIIFILIRKRIVQNIGFTWPGNCPDLFLSREHSHSVSLCQNSGHLRGL